MSNHMCIFEKRARDRLFFERKVRFRLCFGLLLSSAHVWVDGLTQYPILSSAARAQDSGNAKQKSGGNRSRSCMVDGWGGNANRFIFSMLKSILDRCSLSGPTHSIHLPLGLQSVSSHF